MKTLNFPTCSECGRVSRNAASMFVVVDGKDVCHECASQSKEKSNTTTYRVKLVGVRA